MAVLLVTGLSLLRTRLRLSYEAWQLTHGLLAVAVVGLSLAHAIGVGFYTGRLGQRTLWVALSAALVALLGWVRIVKPVARLRRRPWRVEEVRAERGRAWTVVLAPEGHEGLRFESGQFAWLTLGRSPLALTNHPFSFSSSAEQLGQLSFTIKARGDFTASVGAVVPGTRAYIDGPYGLFTIEHHDGPAFLFVAGGVGITPLISMMRTLADRGDTRPVVLVYGNRDWDGVMFREDLEALRDRMSLRVVHVLEQPPAGWSGERGLITGEILRRHLPAPVEQVRCFVCGPHPMMDAIEREFVSLGVPDVHVITERFDMV